MRGLARTAALIDSGEVPTRNLADRTTVDSQLLQRRSHLLPTRDPQLLEQPVRVPLNGPHPQPEVRRDLRVRAPSDDETADLPLSHGQPHVPISAPACLGLHPRAETVRQ